MAEIGYLGQNLESRNTIHCGTGTTTVVLEIVLARTENPPPTWTEITDEIAQKFGYTKYRIYKCFPAIAHTIVEKRRQYDRDKKEGYSY